MANDNASSHEIKTQKSGMIVEAWREEGFASRRKITRAFYRPFVSSTLQGASAKSSWARVPGMPLVDW